ncbi:MAG: response regulator transcription factor [Oscillatoriaceae cyanobacterium]
MGAGEVDELMRASMSPIGQMLAKFAKVEKECINGDDMSGQLLLVDDEPGLREAVQAYLEDSDFVVEVASNAKEGWEILQRTFPDLVITDIMMPQVDGYQFLKQVREDPRFSTLPVVFLTAKGMTGDRIQGYQAGCDAYLSKPFDPEELIAIVNNLLNRRAAQTATTSDNPDIASLANQIAEIKGILTGRNPIPQAPSDIKIDLTPREQSVLDLVSQGLMNKEIARRLDTSVRNVEKYVSRLFSKTGTNSRTELVRYALEHGLTK